MAARIRKNDVVVVIAGKDRGQKGRVLRVIPEFDKVIIEGVNRVRKHRKARPGQDDGGIVDVEAALHVSNVSLIDTGAKRADKATRVRFREIDGKKQRVAVESGAVLGEGGQ